MEKYVLIGHPLGHSMSPFIHKILFEMSGRDAEYSLKDISPENLSAEMEELNKINGYNVTIPHKISVIPFVDKLDATAERYGAVNCVNNDNGTVVGYNTDCTGFVMSAKPLKTNGKTLIIGCGGVGRMIAIELALQGAELTIAVIPEAVKDAEKLISEIGKICPDAKAEYILTSEIKGKFDLLVNASPVGMFPKTDVCPVSDEIISNCGGVFDVIYNPVKTQLVKKAEAMGIKAVGGMAMLVLQAVKAHEIWNNDFYTDEQIAEIIRKSEKKVEEDFQ